MDSNQSSDSQSSDSESSDSSEEYVSNEVKFKQEILKQEKSEEDKKDYLGSLKTKNIEDAKIEADYEEKITNIKSVLHNLSEVKELSKEKEEMNQLKKEMIDSNLIDIISDNQYQFMPERLIDIKKMIREIEEWLKNLHCNHKGCPNQAIVTIFTPCNILSDLSRGRMNYI